MRFDVHPFKDLTEALEWARNEIDQAAGAARARYITIVPGQDATYQAKYADALAFSRAGYPEEKVADYPWVNAEKSALGGTARAAADSIRSSGDPWNMVVGPSIEQIRIGSKNELLSADAIGDAVRIAAEARAALGRI